MFAMTSLGKLSGSRRCCQLELTSAMAPFSARDIRRNRHMVSAKHEAPTIRAS